MTVKKLDATDVRRLIKRASGASKVLESTVRQLVRAEAWRIVGYLGFRQMWEAETGYSWPTGVRNIVHDELTEIKNINTSRGKAHPNGATTRELAEDMGLPGSLINGSAAVQGLNAQKKAGVPTDRRTVGAGARAAKVIREHGTRARGTNRRIGKSADDMVQTSFNLKRRDADAIHEYAAREGITNAEAYRQAVVLFLDKVAPTRARKTQSKR